MHIFICMYTGLKCIMLINIRYSVNEFTGMTQYYIFNYNSNLYDNYITLLWRFNSYHELHIYIIHNINTITYF